MFDKGFKARPNHNGLRASRLTASETILVFLIFKCLNAFSINIINLKTIFVAQVYYCRLFCCQVRGCIDNLQRLNVKKTLWGYSQEQHNALFCCV